VAVIVLAPIVLFGDRLLTGRSLAVGDGYVLNLPLHVLATRALQAGHLPFWNFFSFSGSPLLALGEAGIFYPPDVLFFVLPATIAYDLIVVFSFVVAGMGTFCLARRLGNDRQASLIAALIFELSGYLIGQVPHQALLASVAWLPFALLGLDLVIERLNVPRLSLAGGSLALSMLAGHAQMFFLIVAVLVCYAAIMTVASTRQTRIRPVRALVLTILVGAGVSAVQLFPMIAVHGATSRSSVSYATATSYSYSWSHLPLLLFPYLFGNVSPTAPFTAPYRALWGFTDLSAYPGMAALVFAAAGLGSLRTNRRMWAIGGSAVVAFVAAMGGSTPLGHVVLTLPVYGDFRSWARYMVVVDLAIALFAAQGIMHFRSAESVARRRALRRTAIALGGIALVALLAHVVPAIHRYDVGGISGAFALILPLLAAVAAFGVLMGQRDRRRWAVVLATVLVAGDALFSFGLFAQWQGESLPRSTIDAELSSSVPPAFGYPKAEPGGIVRFLYTGSNPASVAEYPPLTDAKGLMSANGYADFASESYLSAVGNMDPYHADVVTNPQDLWPPSSHVLDLLRVSTLLVNPESTRPLFHDSNVLATGKSIPGYALVRYTYAPRLPDAFVVGSVRNASGEQVLDSLYGRVAFDPASTALVDAQCAACDSATQPGPAGTAHAQWESDQIATTVQDTRPGLLVLSESWFPGWHATVDGVAVPVVRADGLVLGIPVPTGRHEVVVSYEAPGFKFGFVVSAVTILALVLAAVVERRSRHIRSKAIVSNNSKKATPGPRPRAVTQARRDSGVGVTRKKPPPTKRK
jgi:hypothetical protein